MGTKPANFHDPRIKRTGWRIVLEDEHRRRNNAGIQRGFIGRRKMEPCFIHKKIMTEEYVARVPQALRPDIAIKYVMKTAQTVFAFAKSDKKYGTQRWVAACTE
jgi:hypothetical protein